jgi:hypothetical protein
MSAHSSKTAVKRALAPAFAAAKAYESINNNKLMIKLEKLKAMSYRVSYYLVCSPAFIY